MFKQREQKVQEANNYYLIRFMLIGDDKVGKTTFFVTF